MSVLLSLAAISESDSSKSFLCISCFSSDVSEQRILTLTLASEVLSGSYILLTIYLFIGISIKLQHSATGQIIIFHTLLVSYAIFVTCSSTVR